MGSNFVRDLRQLNIMLIAVLIIVGNFFNPMVLIPDFTQKSLSFVFFIVLIDVMSGIFNKWFKGLHNNIDKLSEEDENNENNEENDESE